MKPRVFIGTSGWNYRDWAGGVFYPKGLAPSRWLRHYAGEFPAVEVNNTFYRLPERHVFESWRKETPAGFRFAIKASRTITHMKKLAEPEQHVARLLDHASALGRKLAVMLFQLPPFWKFDAGRLQGLLRYLRRQRIVRPLRVAVEVRHPSWLCEDAFGLLHDHGAALVLADWPALVVKGPVTARFVFVRRHGPASLYSSSYSAAALRREAGRVAAWQGEGRDVYVFFNNDAGGHAVRNARSLRDRVAGA